MAEITIHNPDVLGKPLGQYSQIARVKASEFVFIAGQVATDKQGKIVGAADFDAQCRQVFANIEAGLKSQGASFSAVKSTTDNIPERHIFLARIADQSRSKSKD